MAETQFQNLSPDDRRHALRVAQETGNHRAYLLEKDIWVVATLRVLFEAPFAGHLVFKGGTSLSKAWRAIRRFSEDVDITYDIRAFAPDLVSGAGDEALPPTRSQEKRWTRAIRARLAEWVREQACPVVEEGLSGSGFVARIRAEAERLHVTYEPMFEASGFVRPNVLVEFGARSTGEPHANRPVVCDAAGPVFPISRFPKRTPPSCWRSGRSGRRRPPCMSSAARNAAAANVCRGTGTISRALDEAGIAANALADRALALSVARHKAMFFTENNARGERIDYAAAVSGDLQLVPSGAAYTVLADDYAKMLADGMLLDESEPFDALLEQCAAIEARANAARPRDN